MADRADLLIEIGTEELPPKALKGLSEAFLEGVRAGLKDAGLPADDIEPYAAPRRLALLVRALPLRQADRIQERRGPALQAAFDEDGNATPAAQGFARSCGVGVEDLQKLETDKGAWLVYRVQEPGKATAELVPGIVEQALAKLPIPKRMRWGAGEAEFVRPVQWVVLLLGETPIEAEILGVPAGRETRGHRFHHPAPLYLGEPAAYAPLLETEGKVMASFAARREAIRGQVDEAAARLEGRAVIEDDLLDEVTALVEWPVALAGTFEEKFLAVPQEALISTMQGNQKYFALVDEKGRLMRHFIIIANIESHDPAKIIMGNERVIRPRFADAAFFWEQDKKTPLAARREALKTVVFEKQLGTLYQKTERVAQLAEAIAAELGVDRAQARRAAELSKCDLLTSMVYEFTELQGIMGRYYARHDGEPGAVAQALDEQYMPRQAGDALPAEPVGQVLALADRLDTLVGIFAIGQRPTGTKDPYGLRRAALGVLRILIEKGLDLDLEQLIARAAANLAAQVGEAKWAKGLKDGSTVGEVFDYVMERLKAYYVDQGIAADGIDAVLARRPTRPVDCDRRVRAVQAFRRLPEAQALAAANKRIANILKQAEGEAVGLVDAKRLVEPAERALHEAVQALRADVERQFDAGDYETALGTLAELRVPVDRFFDEVMVMAEDAALKRNRIALLKGLADLFLRAADIARLQQ